ncbi:MAG: hypothetical protein QXT27_02750 [Pyrobaculum sp.]
MGIGLVPKRVERHDDMYITTLTRSLAPVRWGLYGEKTQLKIITETLDGE